MRLKQLFWLLITLTVLAGCIQVKSLEHEEDHRLLEIKIVPSGVQITSTSSLTPINITPTGTQEIIIIVSTPTPTISSTPSPVPGTRTLTPTPTLIPTEEKLSGHIVFVCDIFRDDNTSQICLMKADGSDYRRLTYNGSMQHRDPTFDPTGNYIVYSAMIDGHFQLFKMNMVSTGDIQQLTSDDGDSISPSISPDGNLIAYSFMQNNNRSIRILDQITLESWQIYGSPLGNGWNPIWSYDGLQIMFIAEFNDYIQLHVMNADGTNYRRISNIDKYHEEFDWSPNGSQVGMSIGENWYRSIYIFILDNSLTIPYPEDTDNILPSRSPDGRWIANNMHPNFSPDGEWIAYTSYTAYMSPNLCEISVYSLETGEKLQLTDNLYCDYDPDWGP